MSRTKAGNVPNLTKKPPFKKIVKFWNFAKRGGGGGKNGNCRKCYCSHYNKIKNHNMIPKIRGGGGVVNYFGNIPKFNHFFLITASLRLPKKRDESVIFQLFQINLPTLGNVSETNKHTDKQQTFRPMGTW